MKQKGYYTNKNGKTFYYKDKDKKIVHREDVPAVITTMGESWCQNNEIHRLDGPAAIYNTVYNYNGNNKNYAWYVNGVKIAAIEYGQYVGPKYLQALLDSTKR